MLLKQVNVHAAPDPRNSIRMRHYLPSGVETLDNTSAATLCCSFIGFFQSTEPRGFRGVRLNDYDLLAQPPSSSVTFRLLLQMIRQMMLMTMIAVVGGGGRTLNPFAGTPLWHQQQRAQAQR